jgi:hypothetical protein
VLIIKGFFAELREGKKKYFCPGFFLQIDNIDEFKKVLFITILFVTIKSGKDI